MRFLAACVLASFSTAAFGGPPYSTDDPDPTDPGGFETYLFTEGEWSHGDYDGEAAIEVNYGAAKDLQLSLGLPLNIMAGQRLTISRGDVEVSVKYRLINDERHGFSLATFPALTLPTGRGSRGVEILLPLWAGYKAGPWSLFGGGGRLLRTGPGTRDSWTGGIAVTRPIDKRVTLGLEAAAEGASSFDSAGSKSIAAGGTISLGGPFSLIGRVGPKFDNHGGPTTIQSYLGIQALF